MIDETKPCLAALHEILDEIKINDNFKKEMLSNLDTLERQYQRGDFDYARYIKAKDEILSGKNKDDAIIYYDSYMFGLLKKIEQLNQELLLAVYNDNSYEELKINKTIMYKGVKKVVKVLPPSSAVTFIEEDDYSSPKSHKHAIPKSLYASSTDRKILQKKPEDLPPAVKYEKDSKDNDLSKQTDIIPEVPVPFEKITEQKTELADYDYRKSSLKPYEAIAPAYNQDFDFDIPAPLPKESLSLPHPKKLGLIKSIVYAFQAKEKPIIDRMQGDSNVELGGVISKNIFEVMAQNPDEKGNFLSSETKLAPSIFSYSGSEEVNLSLNDDIKEVLDPYLLEKEIKEIKNLISMKDTKVYKPSSVGYYANITVRKLSIYFIEKFPSVFKSLYTAIRYSNIKILSNTYINIMFLLSILGFIVSIPIFSILFTLGETTSIIPVIFKTLLVSVLVFVVIFGMMFYYPFMRIKNRRRSINTNLPFAIDHMSSVISSGVPPNTMFKLISSSKEYGEISVEMEKISNYIELFGYDALTAIRAIAINTPSPQFKDFLDGFVSTVETGGDLKNYLDQKSKEAMLQYRLERQKYIESLSTYSDIYTGVLIAAPLFFVTALSLLSMIGGSVTGGIEPSLIMTVGTYVAIPMLNVFFIIFLEMNQPEI
ncbi:MAG: type II secretion system F family protein [archaeon]